MLSTNPLPQLLLLAKHQRRFPFGIDCTTAELAVWDRLWKQLSDESVSGTTAVACFDDSTPVTKDVLQEKLSHVVKLSLFDTQKKGQVVIDFLDLFPHITNLDFGPPLYEGGHFRWTFHPAHVDRNLHTLCVRELSGDWGCLQRFTGCRKLELSRCHLDDLHWLKHLPPLEELQILGCTIKSLSGLEKASVRRLVINEPHGPCASLDESTRVQGLQRLELYCTGKFVRFPSCKDTQIRQVLVYHCAKLRDLSGLAEAPHLESLSVSESPADQPRYLNALAGHPTLKHLDLFTFSLRKFRQWKTLFGHIITETEEEFKRINREIRR